MRKAALALVAIVLVGCGQVSPSLTETSAASTTPAEWASLIGPLRTDWVQRNTYWEASGCGFDDFASGDEQCLTELEAMKTVVDLINMTVGPMANPKARTGYVGTPPAEVARAYQTLYDATKSAWGHSTVDCPGTTCQDDASTFVLAWSSLGDAFAAWEPWL